MSRLILLAVIAASGGDRYYATEQYCTRDADTPANTLFSGRLVDAVYERAVSFPMWDRAGGGQAISYIELINTDGSLDSWLSDDWKDVRITLKIVEARAAYSTATQVGVVVIDRLEAPTANTVRFVCRSVFERLEKVITTTYADSITNESLRGKPKPISLGRVRWQDTMNWRLNTSGSTRGSHDLCDGYFEDVLEVRERGLPQTESENILVTTSSPTYFITQSATEGYGILYRDISDRLAAEVRGQVRRETETTTNSGFPTDNAGDPAGWDVEEGGGSGSVTWSSAGVVTITSSGTDDIYVAQDQTLVVGQLYQIEVAITSCSGVASIIQGATITKLRGFDASAGVFHVVFTAAGTTELIGFGYKTGASGTVVISALRCYPVNRIATLAEVVRFAGVTRGSLSTGDLDLTALAAVDTALGYEIGWHSLGGEVRGIDLVGVAAQSFGCAIFQNVSGELQPVMIDEPAVSADFELDELSILSIAWEADEAPGLSTRMNYGRNYAPHSNDDMGGLSPPASYEAIRAELASDVRVVTTTETLDSIYAEAEEREPLESLLSEEADAQAEIDRICALYTQPRAFYSIKAFVAAGSTHTIDPGHTVAVTHSRYGLSAGVNLLVVAARSDFLGNAVDLVLWG